VGREWFSSGRESAVYRELVKLFGNGVVYELMRDAETLCDVIRRDLQNDGAGARCHGDRQELPQSWSGGVKDTLGCGVEQRQACVDDVTSGTCQEPTIIDDEEEDPSDADCCSVTAEMQVRGGAFIPPDIDSSSMNSSTIDKTVDMYNTDYDRHDRWQHCRFC